MGHILSKVFPFLQSVFTHWQIWLSGGGLGGFIVITVGLVEKIFNKPLSKKAYIYLFLICFFLCSCFLSWVERDDQLQVALAGKSDVLGQVQTDKALCQGQISDLKAQSQYKAGVVDALGKQNRDQQNTINNCQESALKLLQPAPQKTTFAHIGELEPGTGRVTMEGVLLTNKKVTPIDMVISCNRDIVALQVYPIPKVKHFSDVFKLSSTSWEFRMDSQPWTPEQPLMAEITFNGSINEKFSVGCSYLLR